MKSNILCMIAFLFFVGSWLIGPGTLNAAPDAALLEAKRVAETKGFIFEASHDEIVKKAKAEGTLQVLSGLDPDGYSPMMNTFKKKYPFIELAILQKPGPAGARAFIWEMKAGRATEYDVVGVTGDFYSDHVPYAKKFDILGMAEHGVLSIPPKMVDPKNRTIVGLGHALSAVAYNKNLISPDQVPDRWEDFYRPELKGRKFLVDIRPKIYSVFASCPDAGLGQEWMVNHARKMRAQDPIWFRGHTRAVTAMLAGEFALHSGTNYHSAMRVKRKDPNGILEIKILDPVPLRLAESEMVMASSANPYSALLFLEHAASPEGQKILDQYEPFQGSIYSPGAALNKAVKGKKVCVNGFETYERSNDWMKVAVEALGFPKAEGRRR